LSGFLLGEHRSAPEAPRRLTKPAATIKKKVKRALLPLIPFFPQQLLCELKQARLESRTIQAHAEVMNWFWATVAPLEIKLETSQT
jgi:hypothetical protein